MQQQGIILLPGNINPVNIDNAVNQVIRLSTHLSPLHQSGKTFDISLPSSQPRLFNNDTLIAAEARSKQLNCECTSHLSELIRKLNAFEDYSQTCSAENWQQAAVHACIYAYTSQARHLMEKALQAVLDE